MAPLSSQDQSLAIVEQLESESLVSEAVVDCETYCEHDPHALKMPLKIFSGWPITHKCQADIGRQVQHDLLQDVQILLCIKPRADQ